MNILFDCSSIQAGPQAGGAAVYTMTLLSSLLHRTSKIFLLIDSKKKFSKMYHIEQLIEQFNLCTVDIQLGDVGTIIEQYQIERFIIPVAQYIAPYKLGTIRCKTYMVIHDIFDIEGYSSKISLFVYDPILSTRKVFIKKFISFLSGYQKHTICQRYKDIMALGTQENVIIVTVSNYTASSIRYHFPQLQNKNIYVYYSPAKQTIQNIEIDNPILKNLITTKEKYFLVISANRVLKNCQCVLKAFQRFRCSHPDYKLITINYPTTCIEGQIAINTLSESDLEHAYAHAQALIFASYFEGFGYPPIEAMKYGTPIIYSNVTSIPEIVGSAGIPFSPFYPADLYRAMNQLTIDENTWRARSYTHWQKMHTIQNDALSLFIENILSETFYD